jgi:hypothetical protein
VKTFGRILLVLWPLLFLDGIIDLEFPNATWNHAAGWVLSVGCPVLVVATLAFVALLVIRIVIRKARKDTPPVIVPAEPITNPRVPWSHSLLLGLIAVGLISGFAVFLLSTVENTFKSSDVYRTSVTTAKGSPEVLAILGSPVEAGWFTSGEISESSDGSGKAALTIPLKGPRGGGRLVVQAGRSSHNWRLSVLQFVPNDKASTVDLINELSR